MDAEEYLQHHDVWGKLQVCALAASGELIATNMTASTSTDGSSVASAATSPLCVFAEHITATTQGQQLLSYRECGMSQRRVLVDLVKELVLSMAKHAKSLAATDYLMAVQLCCTDFPPSIILECVHLMMLEATWDCVLDPRQFLASFALVFGCAQTYSALKQLWPHGLDTAMPKEKVLEQIHHTTLPLDQTVLPITKPIITTCIRACPDTGSLQFWDVARQLALRLNTQP
eukprot:m.5703 g.5703  ORF g.5703 m.5703 type:complete len:230 (-) comp5079_c0_seq2:1894-2583(-)